MKPNPVRGLGKAVNKKIEGGTVIGVEVNDQRLIGIDICMGC